MNDDLDQPLPETALDRERETARAHTAQLRTLHETHSVYDLMSQL